MDQQLFKITHSFFQKLKIPVTASTLEELLYTNPEYPSLAALSDVCDYLNLEHAAVTTTFDQLSANGFPAIIHLNEGDGAFALLEDIGDMVEYQHPVKGKVKERREEFEEKWTHVVFYAAKDSICGEDHYWSKRIQEILLKCRFTFLLLSVIALAVIFGSHLSTISVTVSFILLFVIKAAGWIACLNLVIYGFGDSTSLINKVCRAGTHSGCNDVLHSPASRLFGFLSMSDIGFVYFTGGIISMFISAYANNTQPEMTLLLLGAVCSLPYSFFSVYYQAFKLKKWCPLCLSIIFLLLAEYVLFIFSFKSLDYNIFRLIPFLSTLSCFIGIICLWAYVKPLITMAKSGKEYRYKYYRLKRTPEIFNAQYDESPPVEMQFSEDDIIIGDPDAALTITSVVNTYCNPCAMLHKKLEEILEKKPKEVRLIIRFMVAGKGEEVARYLLELYKHADATVFRKALNEWFGKRDKEYLEKQYPTETISMVTENQLMRQQDWCRQLKLSYTPTIFINDKKVGLEYTMNDLPLLVKNILGRTHTTQKYHK